MSDYYSGRILQVIYEDASSGFIVARMALDQLSTTCVVRGEVPSMSLEVGSWLGFEGKWVHHDKFGDQIQIHAAPVIRGEISEETASSLLASNGVPTSVVGLLKKNLGTEFVPGLRDVEKLRSVLSPLEADFVHSKWSFVVSYFKTLQFLASVGFPARRMGEVWRKFGENAMDVLMNDPWSLVFLGGLKLSQLDEVAQRMGLSLDNDSRYAAAVYLAQIEARGMGHLYVKPSVLLETARSMIPDAPVERLAKTLGVLHQRGELIVDRQFEMAVYEPWFYLVESESARLIQERLRQNLSQQITWEVENLRQSDPELRTRAEGLSPEDTLKEAVALWSSRANIVLSDDQATGVFNALTQPVSILTGLPGTGKTTSMKILVRMLGEMGTSVLLLAPTGIAAKKLNQVTGRSASTVHRAFEARGFSEDRRAADYVGVQGQLDPRVKALSAPGADEVWGYGPHNPYPAEFVVVDETSMVDQSVLFRILSCVSPTARITFLGDAAQLPSVGPGNALRDMIASRRIATVSLTQIFRQDEASAIVHAAHHIHRGETPPTVKGSDFCLIPTRRESEVLEMVVALATKLHKRGANFQVLSPRHSGTVGVTNLNAMLRSTLNPEMEGKPEIRVNSVSVRQGDRVMIVKNNYELDVFNGDLGLVRSVDPRRKQIVVQVEGILPRLVTIELREIGKLVRLAYSCTIHKSQGQEYDYVVMPMVVGFGRQLQRNLLYTAVTRAVKRVFLVGHHRALQMAVDNDREDLRNTLFVQRLSNDESIR